MHRNSRTRVLARVLVCATLVATLIPAGAPSAFAAPNLIITGRGWGHGVGLSQWGAWGFAQHGTLPTGATATGPHIAAYYYPGSKPSVLATSTDKTMLVQLDAGANGSNLGFTHSSWSLKPGWVGTTMTLVFGTKKVTLTWANSPYVFSGSSSSIVVKDKNGHAVSGSPFAGTVDVYPASPGGSNPPLITVVNPSALYSNSYIRYRGAMRLASSGGHVRLVNKLSMQQYLYGVVPRESISEWYFKDPAGTWTSGGVRYNIAALEAQAIVSRGYAWASTRAPLYCDTRDQAYEGHSRVNADGSLHSNYEASSSNAAVDTTLRMFVTSTACPNASHVVSTNFYNSSGGHTCNVEDVWLGSTPYPFYRGVDDPYSFQPGVDPWPAITMSSLTAASKIAAKISGEPAGAGSSVYVRGLSCDRADSGYVRHVDVVWSNGTVTKGVAGDTIRSALGLKSTKFYLGGPYTRIAVGDRYATAAAISRSSFSASGSAACAVVVNGTDAKFADALTASSLAGTANGPVLLTAASSLPAATKTELARLKPKKIYVVGGSSSVATSVVTSVLAADPGATAVRLAGASRYDVAAAVALEVVRLNPGSGGRVMISSGEKWPDSAIAAATAAMAKRPLLLVSSTSLPEATGEVLESLHTTETVLFGGPASIPNAVLNQITAVTGESTPYKRFGVGGNRYDEAVAAANYATTSLGASVSTVYVASGEVFPDSVTGGALAAHNKHPLVLTSASAAPAATIAYLSANRAATTSLVVLGGTGSVSDVCGAQLGGAAY